MFGLSEMDSALAQDQEAVNQLNKRELAISVNMISIKF